MMWFVFDRLWGALAVVQMKREFISVLRLLAQFAKEPASPDAVVARERRYSLRETINRGFDSVRAFADAVVFEFGPSRHQDLAWRRKLKEWQPQVRLLFLTEIALWKYRARLPGFELPQATHMAQRDFDDELARTLNALADRIDGRRSEVKAPQDWLALLEHAVRVYDVAEPQHLG
jgi:multidrug resistance protein MdtO